MATGLVWHERLLWHDAGVAGLYLEAFAATGGQDLPPPRGAVIAGGERFVPCVRG
jgi:hypothetical protein